MIGPAERALDFSSSSNCLYWIVSFTSTCVDPKATEALPHPMGGQFLLPDLT